MEKRDKKVLIISYNFPPMGGGGVIRAVKFCKYLPQFNWQPLVLTVKEHDTKHYDNSLIKEISKTRIMATPSVDVPLIYKKFFKKTLNSNDNQNYCNGNKVDQELALKKIIDTYILIPDSRIGWIPFALYRGLKICKEENVDAIFATGGPWTNLLIAVMLKQMTRLPCIIDFRDSWSENPFRECSSKFRGTIENWMEKGALTKADKVTAATHSIVNGLKKKHPAINPDKYSVILNGFDEEDFVKINTKNFDNFTITHTGNFYGQRTPEFFLKALKALFDEKSNLKNQIAVNFAGEINGQSHLIINSLGLNETVKCLGTMPHDQCLDLMCSSDLLILIIGTESTEVTGKIFEYIASKKPILALTGEGEASNILKKTGLATIVRPGDVNQIKSALYNLYLKNRSSKSYINIRPNSIQMFERKHLTKELVSIFDQCI